MYGHFGFTPLHRYSSKKPQKTSKNPNLSSGSDFVISVYRKDFTKSEPPLKREVIMGQAQGRITNTGGPMTLLTQKKPNAEEVERTDMCGPQNQVLPFFTKLIDSLQAD